MIQSFPRGGWRFRWQRGWQWGVFVCPLPSNPRVSTLRVDLSLPSLYTLKPLFAAPPTRCDTYLPVSTSPREKPSNFYYLWLIFQSFYSGIYIYPAKIYPRPLHYSQLHIYISRSAQWFLTRLLIHREWKRRVMFLMKWPKRQRFGFKFLCGFWSNL